MPKKPTPAANTISSGADERYRESLLYASEKLKSAKQRLFDLSQEHPDVISTFRDLVSEYNQALVEVRSAAIRYSNGSNQYLYDVLDGLKVIASTRVSYDPGRLPKDVLAMPGVVKTVDKKALQKLVKARILPQPILDACAVETVSERIYINQKPLSYFWGDSACEDETESEDSTEPAPES